MSRHAPFQQVQASRPDWDSSHDVTFVKTPQPNWRPGDGVNSLKTPKGAGSGAYIDVDPANHEPVKIYRMLISAVTPRPIAFISTVNKEGAINLAPFSFFNVASSNPPTLMISVSHDKPPKLKETCQNILDTKEYCVNIISENYIEASNFCSINAPPGTSEWALSGLTPIPNKTIKAPRVGEAAFAMECHYMHHYDIYSDTGKLSSTVIIGRVKMFHVLEEIINKDTLLVDTVALAPVARLGGIQYGSIKEVYELERPNWDKFKDTPEVVEALEKVGQRPDAPPRL